MFRGAASALRWLAGGMAAGLMLVSLCWWSGTAGASDVFRECKPLDGDLKRTFDIEKNELRRSKDGALITFKTIDKQRLRQVTGFCNAKGRRYEFSTEIFGLTVELSEKGKPVRQRFRCESAIDATPAGLNCEKEVRSIDFEAPEKVRAAYK